VPSARVTVFAEFPAFAVKDPIKLAESANESSSACILESFMSSPIKGGIGPTGQAHVRGKGLQQSNRKGRGSGVDCFSEQKSGDRETL
jgi:hypothetical protein